MNIEAYSLDLGEAGGQRPLETESDDLDGQIDSVLVDLEENRKVALANKEGAREALKGMEIGDTKFLAPFLATEEKSVVVTRDEDGFKVEVQPD